MANDNIVNLIVNLTGNLSRQAQRYGQSLGQFSARGRRHLNTLERSVNRVDGVMNRLGNRWVALGAGGAVAVAIKGVIDFDAELQQLGVDADITDEKLAGLKKQIHDVANASTIRVGRNDLLGAIKEITARTGDINVALDNLENIGLVMRATGARAEDAAALVANYYEKFDIKKADQMLAVLGESAVLGKKGAFELRDLATEGNSVAAAYAATGRVGPTAIREMNTMLQIIRRTAPSASEAATNFERLIATLTAEKVDVFTNAGIKIWDEEELKKGNKIARAVPDIILDILKVSNADQEALAKVFDIRALRAINAFADEYRKTGKVNSIKEFMSVTDDGSQILNDAARNAKTAKSAINSLTNATAKFADNELSQPIQNLADAIDKLDASKLDEMLQTTKQWAIAIAGVYGTVKLLQAGFKIKNAVGKNKKGSSGVLDAMGSTPATPLFVWVVNNGVGGFGKTRKGAGKIRTGKIGRVGSLVTGAASGLNLASMARAGGQVGAAGLAGYAVGTLLERFLIRGTKVGDVIGKSVAHSLAFFGNDTAQQAVALNKKYRENNSASEPARVEIQIVGDTKNLRIKPLQNRNGPEVRIGTTMGIM